MTGSAQHAFIDRSLSRLPILTVQHLLQVADLPGFCISGLSRGQLQTNIGKNVVIKRFQQQFSKLPVLTTRPCEFGTFPIRSSML